MGRARVCALLTATGLLVGCQQAQPTASAPTVSTTTTTTPAVTTSPPSATIPVTPKTRPPGSTVAVTPKTSSTAKPVQAATPLPLPLPYRTGDASQIITVTAGAYGNTQAILQAWTRTATGWTKRGGAIPAWLGYAGFSTNAREGFNGTPVGSFGLTHAFGNNANPGTRLPYFQSGPDDWWNGDVSSAGYNTHQTCAPAQCRFDTSQSENLHEAGWVYGYAVVIDYNTAPVVPGKGSAFFLHVTENHPTQGCVSIPQAPLVELMRWLDPAQHPRILMGIS